MGCIQTIVKDCSDDQYEALAAVCSSTLHDTETRIDHDYRSDSVSSDSSSDNASAVGEFGLYSDIEISSNESFSVTNEPQLETEDDADFVKIYNRHDNECESEHTCFFLSRFRDSKETYQQLQWERIHIIREIEKPAKSLAQELKDLSDFSWYWGPMSSKEADQELEGQPDGSFLVRDSANSRHLLSVSFRSKGSCCHTRIQCRNKKFSLTNDEGKDSVIELLQQAMAKSKEGVLFYSRRKVVQDVWYPVRLLYPVSRMTKVPSLQFLCRFVIRRNIRCDKLNELPLPKPVIAFLDGNYFRN